MHCSVNTNCEVLGFTTWLAKGKLLGIFCIDLLKTRRQQVHYVKFLYTGMVVVLFMLTNGITKASSVVFILSK